MHNFRPAHGMRPSSSAPTNQRSQLQNFNNFRARGIQYTKPKSILERISEELEPTHNISNIRVEMCELRNEIAHIQNAMKNHQQLTYHAVKSLQIELDTKTKHFIGYTQSLRAEIDNIQVKCEAENVLPPDRKQSGTNETIDYNLHITGSMQLENESQSQSNNIEEQIREVNKNTKQTEEAVNDLVKAIERFVSKNTPTDEKYDDEADNGGMDDIMNAIECLKCEINRIKSSIFIDEEKIIQVNEQMKDMSWKYTDFNRKVNNSLVELHHAINGVKDIR